MIAQAAGKPDVFAHGILSAAGLVRLSTAWLRQPTNRSLDRCALVELQTRSASNNFPNSQSARQT